MRRRPLGVRSATAVVGALAAGAVVTVISTMKVLVAHPEQFGLDLLSYVEGAKRLVVSGTPYSSALHAGPIENVSTNIGIGYLYPPPLAQLFVPISGVAMPVLAWAWALSQGAILLVLLPIVYRRYGGHWDRGHVAALLLAVIAFSPNLVAIYIGNLSGWIAILIGFMLITPAPVRAASAATAMWLKLTPGVFAVGALVDRSTRSAAAVTTLVILAGSLILSAPAWADWIAVLPSIVGLSEAPYTSNLAPPHVLSSTGFGLLAEAARIALPMWFGVLLFVSAWRGHVAAWVTAATGVYLSAPGTAWDHYFVALSPLAVAAWPRATPFTRLAIVGVLVVFGPLRFLNEQVVYQVIGLGLWLTFLTAAVFQFREGVGAPRAFRPTAIELVLKRHA